MNTWIQFNSTRNKIIDFPLYRNEYFPSRMAPKKKGGPKEHPKPWASALWGYRDEIHGLRLQRKTWQEIADHLEQKHSVKITSRAIRNFFVRSRDPKLPAGLENLVPSQETRHAAPPTPEGPRQKQKSDNRSPIPDPETFFADRQRAIEKQKAEAEKLKPYEEEND